MGYGVFFHSEKYFRTARELEYLFFFQNLTLGYMTKTLNQIFFSLHQKPKSDYFFSNIRNQNIFLEKNHNRCDKLPYVMEPLSHPLLPHPNNLEITSTISRRFFLCMYLYILCKNETLHICL